MRRLGRKFGYMAAAAVTAVVGVGHQVAEAAFTLTPPTLSTDELGVMATSILGGLASMWLIRKSIKTINRS